MAQFTKKLKKIEDSSSTSGSDDEDLKFIGTVRVMFFVAINTDFFQEKCKNQRIRRHYGGRRCQ